MKKISIVLFVIAAFLTFSACAKETKQEEEMQNAKIEGSFTAHVIELMPDYLVDDFTLNCAVVNYYLDAPFIVYLSDCEDKEILEEGKTYVFSIEPMEAGKIPKDKIGNEITYLQALGHGPVTISDIREAKEDEIGVSGLMLSYK